MSVLNFMMDFCDREFCFDKHNDTVICRVATPELRRMHGFLYESHMRIVIPERMVPRSLIRWLTHDGCARPKITDIQVWYNCGHASPGDKVQMRSILRMLARVITDALPADSFDQEELNAMAREYDIEQEGRRVTFADVLVREFFHS